MEKIANFHLYLTEDLKKELKAEAQEEQMTLNTYIREILKNRKKKKRGK